MLPETAPTALFEVGSISLPTGVDGSIALSTSIETIGWAPCNPSLDRKTRTRPPNAMVDIGKVGAFGLSDLKVQSVTECHVYHQITSRENGKISMIYV